MCGRFYVEPETDDRELRAIIDEVKRKTQGGAAVGEVFPSSIIATVANGRDGAPHSFPMKWGYDRGSGSPIINARSETAAEKPMFRQSMGLRRCLIPATHYFEWQKLDKGKKKYTIYPESAGVLYLAGLYRPDKKDPFAYCVILTRPASESVAAIHDRMPVILPKEMLAMWLSPNGNAASVIENSLDAMRVEPSA